MLWAQVAIRASFTRGDTPVTVRLVWTNLDGCFVRLVFVTGWYRRAILGAFLRIVLSRASCACNLTLVGIRSTSTFGRECGLNSATIVALGAWLASHVVCDRIVPCGAVDRIFYLCRV